MLLVAALNKPETILSVPEPMHRLFAAAAMSAGAVLMTGCVESSAHLERAHLSGELERRTGTALRVQASTNQLPPGVEIAKDATEDQAVAIALWNNALFQEHRFSYFRPTEPASRLLTVLTPAPTSNTIPTLQRSGPMSWGWGAFLLRGAS